MKINEYLTPLDKKYLKTVNLFYKSLIDFSRWETLFLLIIFFGVGLRLSGIFINQALPDEVILIKQAIGLFTSSSHFKHEGSSFYGIILLIPTLMTIAFGGMKGYFSVIQIFHSDGLNLIASPYFIYGGRIFGILLFIASLFLVFRIGEKFFNPRVGLLASLLLTLSPLYIQTSRLVLYQNMGLLCVGLITYLTFLWFERKSLKNTFYIGIGWGLFCATSFHGIYLAPLALVTILFYSRKGVLVFMAAFIMTYLIATFYLHVDIPLRLDMIAREIILRREYFDNVSFMGVFLAWGSTMNWGLLIFLISAIAFSFYGKNKNFYLMHCSVFILFFFFLFSSFISKRPEDLLLILVPSVLLVGWLIDHIFKKTSRLGSLIVLSLLFLPSLIILPSVLGEHPSFIKRFQSFDKAFRPFNPGGWKSDYVYNKAFYWRYNLHFLLNKEKAIYDIPFQPLSLHEESRSVTFIASKKKASHVVYVMRNSDTKPASINLHLFGPTGEELSSYTKHIPASSEWSDVVFPINYELLVGSRYMIKLIKTNQQVELLFSDQDIYVDQGLYNKLGDILFKVVYDQDT